MKSKEFRSYPGRLVLPFMIFALMMCLRIEGADYTINVNAGAPGGAWNRFYEECVGTCHPITVLSSSYGRNIQNALKRGKNECGFKKIRAHGIFGSDVDIYSENNGVAAYNWTKFDQIYDSVKALGYTVIVEFGYMPSVLASGGQTTFWYNGADGNVTPLKDWNKWRDLCKNVVLHLQQRYGAEEIRKNWSFEVWNEPDLGYFWSAGQWEYLKLYDYAAEGVRLADPLCKVGGPAVSFVDAGPAA